MKEKLSFALIAVLALLVGFCLTADFSQPPHSFKQRFVMAATTGQTVPSFWTVTHFSNAGQSTISRAAATGRRHVAVALTACLNTAAATAHSNFVDLIDGATGGSSYLWHAILGTPAAAGNTQCIYLSGLNIVGSVNTAMTLEFATSPGANTNSTVTLHGYDQ